MNELYLESSPYLLQHAANPVFWKSWSATTLATAAATNKLLLVSIGYSACHWCHVMEHESFENEAAAQIMNASFVNVKVDREERPDVDAVYMKAVQLMTGKGGWPLNVVCLPDGRPVWGGTYFRTADWIATLQQLHTIFETEPEKMTTYAEQLQEGLVATALVTATPDESAFTLEGLETLVAKWKKSFDWEFGGMARAPKFMMPNNYSFLLRYGWMQNDQSLLDFVDITLTKMAFGGLFDTIDGGFSRYAVDLKWHVPHFEKMLYDNGQLVSLYAEAFRFSKNPLYQKVVEQTLSFVVKEWLSPDGGFYAALDADSLNMEGKLEEGAFYAWTKEELQTILGDDFELFATVYNVNAFGFWEHDKYVLIQKDSLQTLSRALNCTENELQLKQTTWQHLLYKAREKRSKPRLDDKCITSWNALMLKGFVDAYKAFGTKKYLDIALQNAAFIGTKIWSEEGNLFHTYKNGKAAVNGYLEDYALVIQAFIGLYEVTLDESWLQKANQLTAYTFDYFFDTKKGFFLFTSSIDAPLVAPHFETEDNVIPASNSVMADNLSKLGFYFSNAYYKKIVGGMLDQIMPTVDYPSACSNWMHVFLTEHGPQKEVSICGTNAVAIVTALQAKYLPFIHVSGSEKPSRLPVLKDRFVADVDLYYVCENNICGLPLTSFESLQEQLLIQK